MNDKRDSRKAFLSKKLIEWLLLYPLSMYRLYSPWRKGKSLVTDFVLKRIWGKLTKELTVYTKDGPKFILHFPEDVGWEYIYSHQSFETGTTDLVRRILRPDDVVFDVGANFGWYTILCSKILTRGQCHAFEPVPWIYDELLANCRLNRLQGNVVFNQLAIGSTPKTVQLYTFPGESHGLSSLSTLGREKFSVSEAQMVTLSEYVDTNNIDRVDFIKCDVEGSELDVVKGAFRVFAQQTPPMWLFEANEETAQAFDHRPSDVLAYVRRFHDYQFYRIEWAWEKVLPMETVHDCKHGDTVLAFVPQFHEDRLRGIA